MITVEYLLPFDTEDGICKNIESFKSLLASNSYFKLEDNKIKFKRSSYEFNVTSNIVKDMNCSVYHVTFGVSRVTDKFREMLKAFRKTVGLHLKDNIQIIWDGVSFEWSKEIYPQIYKVENSLRRLISKFMLINLGLGWHKSSIPKDVTESIKKENFKPNHSILYEVDFIQLSHFLFKSYTIKDSTKLPDILTKVIEDGMDEEKKKEILDYLPKNNWDRYFSDVVNIESGQLKKKWQNLYEIRNKVAHNKSMDYNDLESANNLCAELNGIINNAYNNIDNIEIPDEDIETIGLRTIATVYDSSSQFINNYIKLNNNLSDALKVNSEKYSFLEDISNPLSSILDLTINDRIKLPDKLNNDLFTINNHKNEILSGNTYMNLYNTNVDEGIFQSKKDEILSLFNSDDFGSKYLSTAPTIYNSHNLSIDDIELPIKDDNNNEETETEKDDNE